MFTKKKRVAMVPKTISIKLSGETLAPLMEGPTPDGFEKQGKKHGYFWNWMREHLRLEKSSQPGSYNLTDPRLLLGVIGAPLAPIPVNETSLLVFPRDCPLETSFAKYILQQYVAATGGSKVQGSIRNSYVMGKVKIISSEFETATKVVHARNSSKSAESGFFVLWQMMPNMWSFELAVAGSSVHAGSDGKLVWRHTPWIGTHAAKGPIRPLRRALQGLDPRTTANMFALAKCVGEKTIGGEDCFILKLAADPQTLAARSDGPAEIIRHVLFGYFSQRTGLLIRLEDSHLTRIRTSGGDAAYWETTIDSTLEDYRLVEGINIAHAGRSVVTLFRFEDVAMRHTKTRTEELWTIEEVAYNVPGLSVDYFIPPADIWKGSMSGTSEFASKEMANGNNFSKDTDVEDESTETHYNINWRVEV
ncbi:hypothetical protein O6H91_17G028300 [Diphasiastrum complanatum]|uniref:Uncharacterized protein n=1 Tax=Diphasiastrum complanatum TaxID=34168 RepID=A0ACC2B566_DIPCM|nr:hypothetical protein O6H91_17G028300 [Diphasiastrum complanatum]